MTDAEDWDDREYVHTEGVVLRPNGAVTLIRLIPNSETLAAVMGDWCYGSSLYGSPFTVWVPMGDGIDLSDTVMGKGKPNALAEKVFRRLTGTEQALRGAVLLVNDRAENEDTGAHGRGGHRIRGVGAEPAVTRRSGLAVTNNRLPVAPHR